MKKIIPVFLSLLLLVLMIGCQQTTGMEDAAFTLPNGYMPTALEIQKIKDITPEANGIKARVAGSRDFNALSAVEQKALIDGYIDLLKTNFGSEWKKFCIVKEAWNAIDLQTNETVAFQSAQYKDPESVSMSNSIVAKDTNINPVGNGYYIKCGAEQWWLVWCAWNVSKTWFLVQNGGGYTELPASTIYAKIVDKLGTFEHLTTNASYVEQSDGGEVGFWPKNFSCSTSHRVTYPYITNQDSGVFTFSWF